MAKDKLTRSNKSFEAILGLGVDSIPLSARAMNCLLNNGVRTVRELLSLSDAELLRFPHLGRGTLAEIREQVSGLLKLDHDSEAALRSADALIVKRKVSRTYWVCPDFHAHKDKREALNCVSEREARRRMMVRKLESDIYRAALQELERQHLELLRVEQEAASREAQEKAQRNRELWRKSEVGKSGDLPAPVSLALFLAGVTDRESFRKICCSEDGKPDLKKVSHLHRIHPSEHRAILDWYARGG